MVVTLIAVILVCDRLILSSSQKWGRAINSGPPLVAKWILHILANSSHASHPNINQKESYGIAWDALLHCPFVAAPQIISTFEGATEIWLDTTDLLSTFQEVFENLWEFCAHATSIDFNISYAGTNQCCTACTFRLLSIRTSGSMWWSSTRIGRIATDAINYHKLP